MDQLMASTRTTLWMSLDNSLGSIYTLRSASVFPVADTSHHTTFIDTLRKGLERLSASFPWVAGQVVTEGSSKGNSGVFKIAP